MRKVPLRGSHLPAQGLGLLPPWGVGDFPWGPGGATDWGGAGRHVLLTEVRYLWWSACCCTSTVLSESGGGVAGNGNAALRPGRGEPECRSECCGGHGEALE